MRDPPPFLLLLDLSMEAPVITMPRHSDSEDNIEVNLGSLQLSNVIGMVGGAHPLSGDAVVQVGGGWSVVLVCCIGVLYGGVVLTGVGVALFCMV